MKYPFFRMNPLRVRPLTMALPILALLPAGLASPSPKPLEVYLNPAKTYQTIDGFGAAFISYDQLPAYNDPVFYDLVAYDVGMTIVRQGGLFIFMADENLENTDEQNAQMRSARRVLGEFAKRGVTTVTSSLWSPPGRFKTNLSPIHAGFIRPDKRADLARWIRRSIELLEEEDGIVLDTFSIQNELLFPQPYESCLYSPVHLREMVRALTREFRSSGISTRIMIPEDMGWFERVKQYIDPVMEDPETRGFPGFFCTHGWSGDENWSRFGSLVEEHDRKLWLTETSGYQPDWDGALSLARTIHRVLARGNASGFVYWQFNSREPTRFSLMAGGRHTPKSVIMKHFARFARPGSVRVQAVATGEAVRASAYRNPSNDALSVVLINESQSGQTINLRFFEKPDQAHPFLAFQSTRASHFRELGVVSGESLRLPPESVTTLHGHIEAGVEPVLEPLAPQGVVLRPDAPKLKLVDETDQEKLHAAARANRPDRVRTLIERGFDPNALNVGGFTPLHRSAWPGHIDVIKPLVQGGADPDKPDREGETPLHIAAGRGNVEYIKALLAAGADVNARNNLGETPLHRASEGGSLATVLALIESGATVNQADSEGWTALHRTMASPYREANGIIQALLESGASVDSRDDRGWTPLHVGAMNAVILHNNNPENVAYQFQQLVKAGAHPNARDREGRTALHWLAWLGEFQYVELPGRFPVVGQSHESLKRLLALGADPGLIDKNGKTPSDYARSEGYLRSVEILEEGLPYLVSTHAPEKVTSMNPESLQLHQALRIAAAEGDLERVRSLLQAGANPDFLESTGGTALHEAVINRHSAVVELLLEAGADPSIRDSDGYTPAGRAEQDNDPRILQFLR